MSVVAGPNDDWDVQLWRAYERLGDAYLVRDDSAVRREISLIARLRDQATGVETPEHSTLVERVGRRLAGAVERLIELPLTPSLIRSKTPLATQQGEAELDENSRSALGDIDVSVVVNGAEIGVDINGVDPRLDRRLHVFVEAGGLVADAPLVPASAESSFVSATMPWSAELPLTVLIAVLSSAPGAPKRSADESR